jgi:hypothetical protein
MRQVQPAKYVKTSMPPECNAPKLAQASTRLSGRGRLPLSTGGRIDHIQGVVPLTGLGRGWSMADSDAQEDAGKVASHTLAFLRSLDRKMDLILETQARHTSVWDDWSVMMRKFGAI